MKPIVLFLLLVLICGCSIKPQPIDFGKDACVYCKMNIVDQQHAAEIVTNKGKVFKYDAIECMLKDIERNSAKETNMYLVMDYLNPQGFIDATQATYLVSEAIPSPMGAYLSAFTKKEEAMELVKSENDKVYDWSGINNLIK